MASATVESRPAGQESTLCASGLRVLIAHDWIMEWAGSERVVSELLETFPRARLVTSLINRTAVPPTLHVAEPSILQHFPFALRNHEWLLPLMPAAWRLRKRARDVDLVISSSHACAKAVSFDSEIPHLCYCHTPMRYAWDFESESSRFPPPVRPVARVLMSAFRRWDKATAQAVTAFVANSTAVARRIERHYGRTAEVVYPPVKTDFYTPAGEQADYFLYVGRLTGYKRPDLVVEAFAELPYRLVVVGRGPMRDALARRATPNVEFVGTVDELELRSLYRGARALVYPVNEDFGIAMAEAQACGTPVLGLGRGGALDIVCSDELGVLVRNQNLSELRAAVREIAARDFSRPEIAASAARFSTARFRMELIGAAERAVGTQWFETSRLGELR